MSARAPNTEPPFKVTVLFVLLRIVIGKSPSLKDMTERMSTDAWLTGSNTTNSASNRNLQFKHNEKFIPQCGLIYIFLNNDTVFTV